ncbi:MAG: hypothetical protein IJJ41_07235 [Clostridia bacterium]|nr:hypothetical protein [Clostridia bacterium]
MISDNEVWFLRCFFIRLSGCFNAIMAKNVIGGLRCVAQTQLFPNGFFFAFLTAAIK